MGALPKPDVPPGAQRDLLDALHDLHHRAGWPSLRTLARQAGCSHTTVSAVFSAPRLPSWGTLELLVEAMDGDTDHFNRLWLAASTPDGHRPESPARIAGRRDELAAVRAHLETGGGMLVITGEAGIGKTRLVTTAAAMTSQGIFVAAGSALPLSSEVPLLPVADVLRAVHESDGGQWLEKALSQCAPYVAGSLSLLVPELAQREAPAPGDDWARQRLFAAVETALRHLSAERGLGLLIEDLHWADTATLDLLEHLVSRGPEVSVVGTWRLDDPTIAPANAEWFNRVRRMPAVATLALTPLSRDETAEQLALLTGQVPATAIVDSIHRRTQGQPLFTEQLATYGDTDRPLPSLLADLLDARLGDLMGPAWSAARALGVAARPLTANLLSGITGLAAADLADGLHDLDARRLLAPATRDETALRHPLLAEAIRRRLVPGEAAGEHAAVARALAAIDDPEPAEVARHWQAAGDRENELSWRVRAARAAHERFALRQEAAQWARVQELWPDGAAEAGQPPIRRYDALAPVMDLLAGIDDGDAAAAIADLALRLVPGLPPIEAAELLQGAGYFYTEQGRLEEGVALLQRALTIHATAPPRDAHVRALYGLQLALRGAGRLREGAKTTARAVDVSGALEDRRLYRTMLIQQAWYDARLGDPATAVARACQAAALEVAGPDPRGEVRLAAHHTDLLLDIGADVDEVVAVGQRGLDAVRDRDLGTYALTLVRAYMARSLRRAGQVSRAAVLLDPVTDRGGMSGGALERERAVLDMLRGRAEEARRIADAARGVTETWLESRIEAAEPLAEIDVWTGRPEAVGELVVPLVREAAGTELAPNVAPLLAFAARAAADGGGSAAAFERLTGLHASCAVDPFEARPVPASTAAWTATWRAELSRLANRQSVEMWVAAASEWDRLTRPHDAAYCRWRAAQVAIATGEAALATKLLRRAARDAREHVPLLTAVRETASGAG